MDNAGGLLGLAIVHLVIAIVITVKQQQQQHLHVLWNVYMDLIASQVKIVGKVPLAISLACTPGRLAL